MKNNALQRETPPPFSPFQAQAMEPLIPDTSYYESRAQAVSEIEVPTAIAPVHTPY